MAQEWYYTDKGKKQGPVSADEIQELAASGRLKPTDRVWNEDMSDWVRAGTLPNLFPDAEAVSARASTPLPARPKSSRSDHDDDDDDDPTPRRRSRKSYDREDGNRSGRRLRSSGSTVAIVVIGLALGVLVLGGIAVAVIVVLVRGGNQAGPAAPGVLMTYNVDLQVQGQDIRPINLAAGNRYEFKLKAVNQAGDLDIFVLNNQGKDLAKDDGVAADAFIDFTAPYSGIYKIDVFNAGVMPNRGTITVTDKGVSPNPPNQVINRPANKIPNIGQPPVVNPPKNVPFPKSRKQPLPTFTKQIPGDLFAFLRSAGQENRLADVDIVGFKLGNNTYRDTASDGGLLIGFEFGMGKFGNNDTVNGLRPIYLTEKGEKMGGWCGTVPANPVTVKAKAGYVVGGMNIRTGIGIHGLSLKYYKLDASRLDPADTYASPWIGGQQGGSLRTIDRGCFIAGVTGHLNNQNALSSLGFVAVVEPKK